MILPSEDFDQLIKILEEPIPISEKMREAANRVDHGRIDIKEIKAVIKKPRHG